MSRLEVDKAAYDQYANFSTFLCASALQIISASHDTSYAQRWDELSEVLERWHEHRPSEMRPIFASFDKSRDTFPILVFSNPPAISGNQMFHAASLLMLQAKPKHTKARSSKSMFWHARQIVGISASNRNQCVSSPRRIYYSPIANDTTAAPGQMLHNHFGSLVV